MSSSQTGLSSAGAPPSSSDGAKLEHAYLQLYEPSKNNDLSSPGPAMERIDFQFNPKELTMAKSASWARSTSKGSKKSGPPQYNGPQPSKLALEMFFDASAAQDDSVVKVVDKLFACCIPTTESHQQKKASPPWVVFRWGPLTGFLAYISSVSAKYTRFTSGGMPIRAVCTVTLEELAGEAPKQNPTSGGLHPHRVHTVVAGENLAVIAYDEYGDPTLWRRVADANGVDDPMRLRPGARIFLPSVEELRPPADGRQLGSRARHVTGSRSESLDAAR